VAMTPALLVSTTRMAMSSEMMAAAFATLGEWVSSAWGTSFAAGLPSASTGGCAMETTGLWFVVAKGVDRCAVNLTSVTVADLPRPSCATDVELTAKKCGAREKMEDRESRKC